MGNFDSRNSKKMRRRKAQSALKRRMGVRAEKVRAERKGK